MRIYRAHFYKLIRDPLFYFGIIATALLCAYTWVGKDPWIAADVANQISITIYFATLRGMIAIAGALPFVANFAGEWTSRVTIGCVARCGVKRYAVSNVVVCFVSSLVTVFLGMMLYAGVLSFFMPLFEDVPNNSMNTFDETLLRGGMPWVYIIFRIMPFAAACGMWSVMGMMLTAFFPNKFVGICTPFVASYVIERITYEFPTPINLYNVSLGFVDMENIWFQQLYCVGFFAALSAVFGFVFVIMVKRRVQNEVA